MILLRKKNIYIILLVGIIVLSVIITQVTYAQEIGGFLSAKVIGKISGDNLVLQSGINGSDILVNGVTRVVITTNHKHGR
jgi:hypothetical protein